MERARACGEERGAVAAQGLPVRGLGVLHGEDELSGAALSGVGRLLRLGSKIGRGERSLRGAQEGDETIVVATPQMRRVCTL